NSPGSASNGFLHLSVPIPTECGLRSHRTHTFERILDLPVQRANMPARQHSSYKESWLAAPWPFDLDLPSKCRFSVLPSHTLSKMSSRQRDSATRASHERSFRRRIQNKL